MGRRLHLERKAVDVDRHRAEVGAGALAETEEDSVTSGLAGGGFARVDVAFFKAVLATRRGDAEEARAQFALGSGILPVLPSKLRERILRQWAVAAVEAGDDPGFHQAEDELKRLGGLYEKAADWASFAVTDGRLVTGQNPASSRAGAEALLKLLA